MEIDGVKSELNEVKVEPVEVKTELVGVKAEPGEVKEELAEGESSAAIQTGERRHTDADRSRATPREQAPPAHHDEPWCKERWDHVRHDSRRSTTISRFPVSVSGNMWLMI